MFLIQQIYIDSNYGYVDINNYQERDEFDLVGTATSLIAIDQVHGLKSIVPLPEDLKPSGRSTLLGYLNHHGKESTVIESKAEISGNFSLLLF